MIKCARGFLAFGLAALLAGVGRAEEKDCRAIIDKAIQATGGEEQIAKYKAFTWKEKGTFYGAGTAQPFTGKYAFQGRDQFRMEIEGFLIVVLNGNKGWFKESDNTKEMNKDQLAQQRESQYAQWVTKLVPLKDKAFHLSSLGESKVGDRAVVGIKVSHNGHNDIKLYFDKENGLLLRSDFRYKDAYTGKDTEMTVKGSGFKEFRGLKLPTKLDIKRDGNKFVEAEVEEWEPKENLDDSVFAKP